jgi:peptidoglycan/xylan/chitin deacetylase (PgdA/CDA1 family)
MPSAIILAYHRVAAPQGDPQLMCVAPERFADHLRVIRECGVGLSLRHLVHERAARRVTRRGVVITFDDGYLDNLENAEPLLRRAGLPATVFVTTGGLEDGHPFWWDELQTLLLEPPVLPSELEIKARGKSWCWNLSDERDTAHTYARWDVTQRLDPLARQRAYRSISALCRDVRTEEREEVIAQVRQQIGDTAGRCQARRMSPDQVAQLSRSEVVEVGSHGVMHVPFGIVSAEEARYEMRESRKRLTALTGREVDLLSYPFGSRSDLADDTARLGRDCGFLAACANWPGSVWSLSDRYLLPRHLVRDWDGAEFADKLQGWLRGSF